MYGALDYVHTVSFSLAFYIVLRPQGIRKQMKTLRKRHRVHIALVEGGGLEAPLSFKMMQWSCNYCIRESVCYWLEKGNSMDT